MVGCCWVNLVDGEGVMEMWLFVGFFGGLVGSIYADILQMRRITSFSEAGDRYSSMDWLWMKWIFGLIAFGSFIALLIFGK